MGARVALGLLVAAVAGVLVWLWWRRPTAAEAEWIAGLAGAPAPGESLTVRGATQATLLPAGFAPVLLPPVEFKTPPVRAQPSAFYYDIVANGPPPLAQQDAQGRYWVT